MEKYDNNRVTQEGNEDLFEYNADKIYKEDSGVHKKINVQGNKNEERENLHGKPGDVSAKLNSNSDSNIDPSDGDVTYHLIKHYNFDYEMASFYKTTVQFLQKINFHRNVLKFVLGCIPSFDAKISAMKKKVDGTPFNPVSDFSATAPFKTCTPQH